MDPVGLRSTLTARSRLSPNSIEKDMHRTSTIVALAATGLFAFTASAATAETITVCASGCDYTSIRTAIDNASDGDVSSSPTSRYAEDSPIDTLGKAITIRGATDESGHRFPSSTATTVIACCSA